MADTIVPSSTNPTAVTQYNYGFAPEVAPFAQDLLANAASYTDPMNMPYLQYQGAQNAQFSPLQNQAFQNAALMQTAPQQQQGTAIAGQAGLGALNTQYTYNPYQNQSFTSPGMAQAYMNPYLQASLAPQLAIQQQLQGAAQQTQNAQATQAGAFGGSRAGVQAAATGLNNQLANQNLIGQGYNTAYNNAQNQFNAEQGQTLNAAQLNAQQGQFGANLGLQGLNTALQSASTLGNLGNQQFSQNVDINQLQNAAGTQQQQQAQNILNTQYQNYQNAQNYPYQQMGFMSDIIRGLPTSQTASSVYQAPPSTAQTVASLGLGAAGLSKLFAKGGHVNSHGLGGIALRKLQEA